MARATPCPCGCKDWHVEPNAALQGVSFTKEQAEAVAWLLDELEAGRDPRETPKKPRRRNHAPR